MQGDTSRLSPYFPRAFLIWRYVIDSHARVASVSAPARGVGPARYDKDMLKTDVKGEAFLHRKLWHVVEMQSELSATIESGAFYTDLVAMVFAFHTVEAYLNFVGALLAPDVWKDERNYFRKEPYRGFEGKLRKVMELVSLPWNESDRPLRTVLDLKELRDLIAHPKTEKLSNTVYSEGTATPFPLVIPTLNKLVTVESRAVGVEDVERFIEQLHELARPKANYIWFGPKALHGPEMYAVHSGQIMKS